MELGITTFAESYPVDGRATSHGERLRQVLQVLRSIELLGTEVAPLVAKELAAS